MLSGVEIPASQKIKWVVWCFVCKQRQAWLVLMFFFFLNSRSVDAVI